MRLRTVVHRPRQLQALRATGLGPLTLMTAFAFSLLNGVFA